MKRIPLLRFYLTVERGFTKQRLEKCKLDSKEKDMQNDAFKSLVCPNTTSASIACRSNLHSAERNIPPMTLSSLIIISFA